MKVMLKNVRLSFPSLFKTEEYNGVDTEKFAATFLIPKSDTKTVASIESAYQAVLVERYGQGKIPKGFKTPLVDDDDKEYQGYQDHYSIKASTKNALHLLIVTRLRLSKKTVFCMLVAMLMQASTCG